MIHKQSLYTKYDSERERPVSLFSTIKYLLLYKYILYFYDIIVIRVIIN